MMQITNGCRQQHDVTRGQAAVEQQLSHATLCLLAMLSSGLVTPRLVWRRPGHLIDHSLCSIGVRVGRMRIRRWTFGWILRQWQVGPANRPRAEASFDGSSRRVVCFWFTNRLRHMCYWFWFWLTDRRCEDRQLVPVRFLLGESGNCRAYSSSKGAMLAFEAQRKLAQDIAASFMQRVIWRQRGVLFRI